MERVTNQQLAMMPIEFKLNGQTVVGRPDEPIITTARKHGVEIPHLCHGGNQRSDGNCRACVVEIKGERTLAPSCCRFPSPGMEVTSDSPRALASQKLVLELLLSDMPQQEYTLDNKLRDWGRKLGYEERDLHAANSRAIRVLEEIRKEYAQTPTAISGCLGPRGDGYNPARRMTEKEAEAYHGAQVGVFADSAADLVSAITMNYVEEAVGIARAARKAGMPAVISFTVETDGRLPTGEPLWDAIAAVDAATGNGPAYYMINCAHPDHFEDALKAGEGWLKRIRGLRANASRLSHAELDEATELDAGNPVELGQQYRELRNLLPQIVVMGGCCGTDHRHIEAICHACISAEAA